MPEKFDESISIAKKLRDMEPGDVVDFSILNRRTVQIQCSRYRKSGDMNFTTRVLAGMDIIRVWKF